MHLGENLACVCTLVAKLKAVLLCVRLNGIDFDDVDLKGITGFQGVEESVP